MERLKICLIRHLETQMGDSLVKSLLMRKFQLDEIHAHLKDDTNWEYFKEWESIQNLLEDAKIDFMLDSDDEIHLMTMEF